MFEESSSPSLPPKNLPAEPVDMLAGTDIPPAGEEGGGINNALSAGVLKRKVESGLEVPSFAPAEMLPTHSYEVKNPVLGKVLLALGGLLLLGAIGFGAWWFYNRFIKKPVAHSVVVDQIATTTAVVASSSTVVPPVEVVPTVSSVTSATSSLGTASTSVDSNTILFGESNDSDKDGLDNAREQQLGTDISSADTDKDGLTDGDEIIFWKTDPLKPDTDGDGYTDGEEVKNGYNPLGPGKLVNPVMTTSSISVVSTTFSATSSFFTTSSLLNPKVASTTQL